jgi:lipoprotein-anchoring transpeptidase ErfK/SrfK
MLNRIEDQMKKMAAMTSVLLIAAAEALAQDEAGRAQRRIVVSIPDRKLAVIENDRLLRTFDIAVGAPHSPSPVGSFTVVNHIANPTWYYKGKIVGPGQGNPVGTRWMGLSARGYGIHGTNVPSSIGKNVSHGCIRLRNSDIEQLFEMVAVGDQVELHGERTEEIARLFPATPVVVVAQAPVAAANAVAVNQ